MSSRRSSACAASTKRRSTTRRAPSHPRPPLALSGHHAIAHRPHLGGTRLARLPVSARLHTLPLTASSLCRCARWTPAPSATASATSRSSAPTQSSASRWRPPRRAASSPQLSARSDPPHAALSPEQAGAECEGIPLYQYFAKLAGNDKLVLPVPCFNVINGGSHAGNKLAFQAPPQTPSPSDAACTTTTTTTPRCRPRNLRRPHHKHRTVALTVSSLSSRAATHRLTPATQRPPLPQDTIAGHRSTSLPSRYHGIFL